MHKKIIFGIVILVALFRIYLTYSIVSTTCDEPAHIAAGLQYLDEGVYRYEPQHPPLARIAMAIGPYLSGYHSTGGESVWIEGARLMPSGSSNVEILTLARFGNMPFFILATFFVWVWARRIFDDTTALLAAGMFTVLPTILAHSSVATTDMAITATFVGAMLAWSLWLETPTMKHGVLAGVAK